MTDKAVESADEAANPLELAHVTKWIVEPFDEAAFVKAFQEHIAALAGRAGMDKYSILFLLDASDEITTWHSNRIYRAASAAKKEKPILLVIHSHGGRIEPGYLISKTCKRLAKGKFVIGVPRKAKSAATLVCLGADEIHMGLMSELGPIDPQVGGLPALGTKNALHILSELAAKYPGASQMLGEFLKDKLNLNVLGYFERISESAMQYAERLLDGKKLPAGRTARELADHLVNHYKDHGFVIDFDESRDLLGKAVVKQEEAEYYFANEVYEAFDFFRFMLDLAVHRDMDLVGSLSNGVRVFERKKKTA